ncbi:RNase H domain-containing protein [Trichonephila clavata]|uniref:RNase H domain-containing protein n=1 Tax=Trichonephila clavata TaxID=2740835 RepID=A0A8X6H2Z3_TRICU|nr:RNase H domain-containing protein [Trichonephila clavata]
MKTNTEEFRYRFRNLDNSSVFHSELVAIREALNLALDNRASDTWILTDSKSSIQFLKDWSNVLDMLGQDILSKLAALTQGMASASHIIARIGASVGQLLNEEDVVFNLIKRTVSWSSLWSKPSG